MKSVHSVFLAVIFGMSFSALAIADKINPFDENSCPGKPLTHEELIRLIDLPDSAEHAFGTFTIYYHTRTCYKVGGKCSDSDAVKTGLFFKPSFSPASQFFTLKDQKGLVSVEFSQDTLNLRLTASGENIDFDSDADSDDSWRKMRITSALNGVIPLSSR